jgi:hypothetical protein
MQDVIPPHDLKGSLVHAGRVVKAIVGLLPIMFGRAYEDALI